MSIPIMKWFSLEWNEPRPDLVGSVRARSSLGKKMHVKSIDRTVRLVGGIVANDGSVARASTR